MFMTGSSGDLGLPTFAGGSNGHMGSLEIANFNRTYYIHLEIYKDTMVLFANQNDNFNSTYAYNHLEIYKGRSR
jgi:hypothetical protein